MAEGAPATRRRKVTVRGQVQGVWFRDSCRSKALAEGVAGYVRNDTDGSVEACFEGAPDAVDRLVAWCHHGPSRAVVVEVKVREQRPVGESGFKIF
ncbi:MAG: acylphosphatase [Acidimicrobiales bacterium]